MKIELSSVLYLEIVTHAPTVKSIPDEKRTLYVHMREIISTKGKRIYKYIKSYYNRVIYVHMTDAYKREIYIHI